MDKVAKPFNGEISQTWQGNCATALTFLGTEYRLWIGMGGKKPRISIGMWGKKPRICVRD